MTVLSAARAAAVRLNQVPPTSLFTTSVEFDLEMASLANESAEAIAKIYDWQKLIALKTMTGDDVTTSFPLPTDYDRMTLKSTVQTSALSTPYAQVRDLDQWLYFQLHPETVIPGYYIILGGAMQFNPAIPTGVTAKYYYMRNTPILDANSGPISAFTADTDTFVLPERLLRLDLIWRWRSSKKMEYAEDMATFEMALEQEIGKDKGSRILVTGRKRMPADVTPAYPAPLG